MTGLGYRDIELASPKSLGQVGTPKEVVDFMVSLVEAP
jgi:type I restriction-modification system DNA methylase subunit